jgi:hypothetical protein
MEEEAVSDRTRASHIQKLSEVPARVTAWV